MWNSGIILGGFRGILYFDGLLCLQGSGWQARIAIDSNKGKVCAERWIRHAKLWSSKHDPCNWEPWVWRRCSHSWSWLSASHVETGLLRRPEYCAQSTEWNFTDDVLVLLYRVKAQKGCCEIGVYDALAIPPRSCRMIVVEVDPRELANGEKTDLRVGAVEGLSTFADISGLVMVRGVVAVYYDNVPVNLINVHDTEITLHQGKTWEIFNS